MLERKKELVQWMRVNINKEFCSGHLHITCIKLITGISILNRINRLLPDEFASRAVFSINQHLINIHVCGV